ncbi:brcc3 [Scenedesmus sp. PABB004]|nr:brcc3 [Scenedesmus sp. PABB004]
MGLLLGDIRANAVGGLEAHIRRAVPQIRTDRRKDRVETSPEQMAACSALAEHVSASTGLPTRVVGWYHSHPHITVLPSHVDVNTQAMYQLLDGGFVGLIFSVFNAAASREQTIQVTAFQSLPGGALEGVGSDDLEGLEGLDSATADAIRASAADMQSAAAGSWQRKEVPLAVAASGGNPSTLSDYVEVQRMLLEEEQQAHQQHTGGSAAPRGALHAALLAMHGAAVQQQALLQHAECVLAPALAAMQQLAAQADLQAAQLEADNARLQGLLAKPAPAAALEPPREGSPPLVALAPEAGGDLLLS